MAQKITARIPSVTYGYIEVEADTTAEFEEVFAYGQERAALWVDPDGRGMANLQAGLPSTPVQPGPSGPPPWAVTNTDEAQSFIPPAAQQQPPSGWQPSVPQQQYQQPAPRCAHGERKYVAKANWKAWMCPTPKGTPGQCEPEWIR